VPVVCLVLGVVVFVGGARFYYSLPVAERQADGDPFSADAGIWLGAVLVLFALLLTALVVGAALPRRLDSGLGVFLLIGSLVVLGLVAWGAMGFGDGWFTAGICLPFAYVPSLTIFRLAWQSSRGPRPPTILPSARPTSTST
jgi:hypothetical protein